MVREPEDTAFNFGANVKGKAKGKATLASKALAKD